MTTAVIASTYDIDRPPAEPPTECEDDLMWRHAFELWASHGQQSCSSCAEGLVCEGRSLARQGLETACGRRQPRSDYWLALISLRRREAQRGLSASAEELEQEWRTGRFEGEPLAQALARQDIGAVFRYLRSRGWSRAAIAAATRLQENAVRDIWLGRRRVEKYDLLLRVAEGLKIPRCLIGLGLATNCDHRPTHADAVHGGGLR